MVLLQQGLQLSKFTAGGLEFDVKYCHKAKVSKSALVRMDSLPENDQCNKYQYDQQVFLMHLLKIKPVIVLLSLKPLYCLA